MFAYVLDFFKRIEVSFPNLFAVNSRYCVPTNERNLEMNRFIAKLDNKEKDIDLQQRYKSTKRRKR